MFVNLLANIGIILINIYIVWKIAGIELDSRQFTCKQQIQYTVLESIVGSCLMLFSVTFVDVRFDFRFILVSLSMKYLGARVTISTIAVLAIVRFAFGGLVTSIVNLVTIVVLMLTIKTVYKYAKRRFKTLGQLLIMNYYYNVLLIPGSAYLLKDVIQVFEIFIVSVVVGTIFTMIVYSVMNDVQNLTTQTITDGLTGLYNSRKFYQDLESIPQDALDYAIVILDIDDFKGYNDLHGHLVGDEVIRALSSVLKSVSVKDYSFYRYGGEEFVTILKDNTGKSAYNIAERIKAEVNQMTIFDSQGKEINFTVSIGIAYQRKYEELLTTFDRADKALFVAKANGKNQIIIG